ncbi:MAG: CPBP family intramembrane metalloprotease [Coriobacteriia bacterium]|nr:CPBP family intramembrane metalloprotease [Coriobacteriia bacterium]
MSEAGVDAYSADAQFAWPVRHAVALVLAVAGLAFLGGRVLRAVAKLDFEPAIGAFIIVSTYVLVYGIQLGIIAFVASRRGVSFADSVALRAAPRLAGWIALSVGLAFILRLVALAYSGFMVWRGWLLPGWDANPLKYFPPGIAGGVAMVLIIVVMAPVVEEMVFRGVFLPALSARVREAWAIAISSAVFSAMHLNMFGFLPVLFVGVSLAVLRLRSKSLWAPIACHAAFNGIGIAAVFLLKTGGAV